MEASQETQLPLQTLEERAHEEVRAVYERHGYLHDGEPSKAAVEDKIYDAVSHAVVETRADRGKVAVTQRRLMAVAFPQVPGPEAWAEQDDPELAAKVYSNLQGLVWRLVVDDASGRIQSRLNSDIGMILCRTRANPDKVWAVYVTRDLSCLLADFTGPQQQKIAKETKRFATNLSMAVERLPEHAGRFKRELTSGMKLALNEGTGILAPAIEAAKADLGGTDADDDGDE